VTKLETTQEIL